jgi:hypothetical protein
MTKESKKSTKDAISAYERETAALQTRGVYIHPHTKGIHAQLLINLFEVGAADPDLQPLEFYISRLKSMPGGNELVGPFTTAYEEGCKVIEPAPAP